MALYDVIPGLNALSYLFRNNKDNLNEFRADQAMKNPAPASTANAVAGAAEAADQPAYPTAFRSGYDAGVASLPKASQSMGPPRPTLADLPGSVANRAPNADVPYPDFTAQAPASQVMARAPQITFNAAPAPTPRAGLFAPGLLAGLQSMQERGHELLASGGLVDNWRGRQLLRAHARYAGSIAELANADSNARNAGVHEQNADTAAFRASNEVPLELMKDYTARRGQDLQFESADRRDRTTRYVSDAQTATSRYATDANTAIHAPAAQRQDAANRLFLTGRKEEADALAGLGTRHPVPHEPKITDVPAAGAVLVGDTPMSYADIKLQSAQRAAQRKREIEDYLSDKPKMGR